MLLGKGCEIPATDMVIHRTGCPVTIVWKRSLTGLEDGIPPRQPSSLELTFLLLCLTVHPQTSLRKLQYNTSASTCVHDKFTVTVTSDQSH